MKCDLYEAITWHNSMAGFVLGQSLVFCPSKKFKRELQLEAEGYAIHARLLWEMVRAGEA